MLELLLCSAVTVLPDFLYRRFVQGKRLGREIVLLLPARLAPDFEMTAHTDQVHGLLELGISAQLRRNQQTTGGIRRFGTSITDHHALDRCCPRIEGAHPGHDGRDLRTRDHEAR